MPAPTDTDPSAWHRHFASQANNRAWDLAESRGDASHDAEMLAAAHAAAWHWNAVGTDLHRLRATMLLALVNALAGHGATALAQAEAVREGFLPQGQPREGTPDWELAFVHAILALAAHAAGRGDLHAAAWARAQHAIEAIADPEDRAIVLKTWARVPAPRGAV
jgi:hypothetical protein